MPSQPYADAAGLYWRAGWAAPLPLPERRKKFPPRGWTGVDGAWPSWPDIQAWIDDTPTSNIALRMPRNVIGIDVDDYDQKAGGQTFAACLDRWGPLPDTWASTARDDGVSRIRFYRVPEGLRWPSELPGGDVEIVQARHRYAVAWPSVHPDLGTSYRWYTPDGVVALGAVPRVDELPWLPRPWIDGLTAGDLETDAHKAALDGDDIRTWGATVPTGDPCRRVQTIVRDARLELAGAGSRHDAMNRAVGRLVRAADGGHTGFWAGLGDVRDAFETAVGRGGSGQRDGDTARSEFARGFSGAVALVVGDPTPDHERNDGDPCDNPWSFVADDQGDGLPHTPVPTTPLPAAAPPAAPPTAAAPAPDPTPTPTAPPATDGATALDAHEGPADFTDLVDPDDTPTEAPQPSSRVPDDGPGGDGGPGRERSSWWRRDLGPILAGRDTEPPPTVLTRTDGAALLYPGKVNGLLGASESGKTWVALAAVAEQLIAGHSVLYFDFEDTPGGIVERLRALGVPDSDILDRFDYVDPDESLKSATTHDDWRELISDRPRTLIVLDGLNAALTLLGLDLNDNTEVTRFSTLVLRPMSATGAAVLTIDHIPKDKEKKSDGGIGAQAKRAMMTGCAIRCDVVAPFGRGQVGKLRLTVDKDRPGKVRANAAEAQYIGTAHLSPADDDGVDVTIRPVTEKRETTADGGFRPTGLMTAVSQFLAATPAETFNGAQVERGVHGSNPTIRQALTVLVSEGYVDRKPGPRNSVVHQHRRPYSELAELVDFDGDPADPDVPAAEFEGKGRP